MAGRVMTANLFDSLTGTENTELYIRLHRAGRTYNKIADLLTGTRHFGWYIDAWSEINGLLHDLNDTRPAHAPPAFVPDGEFCGCPGDTHRPPCPHALAFVPTGTGWPVTYRGDHFNDIDGNLHQKTSRGPVK